MALIRAIRQQHAPTTNDIASGYDAGGTNTSTPASLAAPGAPRLQAAAIAPHATGLAKNPEVVGSAINDSFVQARMPGDESTTILLTMFIAKRPSCLSKSFRLDASGALLKEQGGRLSRGEAQRLELAGLSEFADLLRTLTPENALSYGVSDHERAIVVPKDALERERQWEREHPVIARTRDAFRWPEGPGIMMVDYDPAADEDPWPCEQLLGVLRSVCPDLERSPHLWRPSASSCIHNRETGEELRGIAGQRIYILVADAGDIVRAGGVLFKRLWLAGYGRIDVSKSGSSLLRGPVDAIVWQPERLDFCGGAYCEPPLTQRLPASVLYNTDALPLDTRAALPDLTEDEEVQFEALVAQAQTGASGEAAKALAQWIECNHDARLERLKRARKLSEDELAVASQGIKESLKAAVEHGRLYADHELILSDGNTVTVRELLGNPERYHGTHYHDPIEPDYPDERIGYINLRAAGTPYIWSHAHGGRRFSLHRARRMIRVVNGELPRVVEQCLELARIDGALFVRGTALVRINSAGQITLVDRYWLGVYLDTIARFEKYDGRAKKMLGKDCPDNVTQAVIARAEDALPELRAVLDAPTIDLRDRRLIDRDGYDPATGLLLRMEQGAESMPDNPNEAELRKAAETLWKPFAEFPFCGPVDRSVLLAAVLTACIRPQFDTAPGFGIIAPTPSSGKTLIARCLALLSGDKRPQMVPPTESEEEWRKRLLSVGLERSGTLIVDNVKGHLDSDALCAFLTAPFFKDRLLGHSKSATVPTNVLFVVTGNNTSFSTDLARRILVCRIDPQMERPYTRRFALNPATFIVENRQDLMRDALMLLRAHWYERRPKGTLGGYETWDAWVGQCVSWIGERGWVDVSDPVAAIEATEELDPDMQTLHALMSSWQRVLGELPVKVAQLVKSANRYEQQGPRVDLYDVLNDIAGERGEINVRRLGRWIARHRGCVCEAYRIERVGEKNGSALWKVVMAPYVLTPHGGDPGGLGGI